MIYTLFILIAFAMLGMERLWEWRHPHSEVRHPKA